MHSVIPIIPKTTYATPTGTSATTDIVLAKLVNTAPFVSAVVVTRVHVNAAATWSVVVQNASYCEEEPNTVFTAGTVGETAQPLPTAAAPNLVVTNIATTPLSHFVRVLLRMANTAPSSVTISVDIVGRDA